MVKFLEFEKELHKQDSNSKGNLFEDYTKWYLENSPLYNFKKVWLWDDWPKKGTRDIGIDLIAEDEQGFWAIQSKAYDKDSSISKKDIDSFLSISSTKKYVGRYLIATTDKASKNALSTLTDHEKTVFVKRSDLLSEGLDWPKNINSKTKKIVLHKPRLHQKKAIEDVLKGFKKDNRGQLVMACGTGKTLVGLRLHEELSSKLTVLFVPSLSLIKQNILYWAYQKKKDFSFRAICSDAKVTKTQGTEYDSFIDQPSDIGVPPITDPKELADFISQKGSKVIFSTYQSAHILVDALKKSKHTIDLILADEAHNIAGDKSGMFAKVLDNQLIPSKRRLFLTATPRVYSARVKKAAEENDLEVISMDSFEDFGSEFHNLTFGEAIKKDLLTNYQIVISVIRNHSIQNLIQEAGILKKKDFITNAHILANSVSVLRTIKKYNLKRVLSYHSRIKSAQEFQTHLRDTQELILNKELKGRRISFDYIEGKMDASTRSQKISSLENLDGLDTAIITNARCLQEGVDIAKLDGITFVDPKSSEIDIIQSVGRVIRKSNPKDKGTILIPLFIDNYQDPEVAIDNSQFSRIGKVLRALRSHDESLGEEIDQYQRSRATGKKRIKISPRIIFDIPTDLPDNFLSAITSKIVDLSSSNFIFGLSHLERFIKENKNARVPDTYETKDGFRLGRWVGRIRSNKRKGKLSQDKIDQLDMMEFIWDPLESDFIEGLNYLKFFKKKYGHVRVSNRYKTKNDFALGPWINSRRNEKKSGKISQERINLLDELGFVWGPFESDFTEALEYLKKYKKEYGHVRVPPSYKTEDGFNLGTWVTSRRISKKLGKTSQDKIDQLDTLGFEWDPYDEKFISRLNYLKEFKEEYGHIRVPVTYKTKDGIALGAWLGRNKRLIKSGKLSQDKVVLIEDLGLIIDIKEEQFILGVNYLKKFKEEYGHIKVPARYETTEGFNLGGWAASRRNEKKSGKISQERINLLDELGFVWDPFESDFIEALEYSKIYKKEYGHIRVPVGYKTKDNFELGNWIAHRRRDKREGTLSQDKIDQLDMMEFTWDPLEANFIKWLEYLKKFKEEYGHIRVPASYKTEDSSRLGRFVSHKRDEKKSGKLSQDKIDRLDELGFVWDVSK